MFYLGGSYGLHGLWAWLAENIKNQSELMHKVLTLKKGFAVHKFGQYATDRPYVDWKRCICVNTPL